MAISFVYGLIMMLSLFNSSNSPVGSIGFSMYNIILLAKRDGSVLFPFACL